MKIKKTIKFATNYNIDEQSLIEQTKLDFNNQIKIKKIKFKEEQKLLSVTAVFGKLSLISEWIFWLVEGLEELNYNRNFNRQLLDD